MIVITMILLVVMIILVISAAFTNEKARASMARHNRWVRIHNRQNLEHEITRNILKFVAESYQPKKKK